jgi:hypothetical protein
MVLPLAWLDGTAVDWWWLATASRVAHAAKQRWSSVSDGEEEKWERPPPIMPTRGIRSASPRGMAATGGVRSPSCHHARCRASGTCAAD